MKGDLPLKTEPSNKFSKKDIFLFPAYSFRKSNISTDLSTQSKSTRFHHLRIKSSNFDKKKISQYSIYNKNLITEKKTSINNNNN